MQFFRFTAFFLVISLNLQGQGRDYQGPDDPAGDPSAERSGYMTGNRVLIFFKNTLLSTILYSSLIYVFHEKMIKKYYLYYKENHLFEK